MYILITAKCLCFCRMMVTLSSLHHKDLCGLQAQTDPMVLCMLGNCNLVMYDSHDTPRWTTQSGKLEANMCRLQLTDFSLFAPTV